MNQTRTIAFVFAVTVCLVATVVGPPTSSALGRTAAKICPTVTGIKWTLPTAPYTTGTQYDLQVHGRVTCRQAATYVKTLVQRHVQTDKPFDGPKGWTCKAQASKSGRAYVGTCQPKRESFLPSDYFTWTVG